MSFIPSSRTGNAAADSHTSRTRLPKHILSGYWHNWQASPAAFIPLRQVVPHFDVINLAFATPASGGDGRFEFVPYGDPEGDRFDSDVRYLQSRGKKVLLSIGGAAGSAAIDTPGRQEHFTESIVRLIRRHGFDGMDINLEGRVILESGDEDFERPTSASIRHLTAAIRDVCSEFGPEFLLSLAPETVNVQGGHETYRNQSGSYLPVIHALRDVLSYVQVQHYNSGAQAGGEGRPYAPGTPDFHAAMADMLLTGFSVPNGTGDFFPPLKPEQVVLGFAAHPRAVSGGYTPPSDLVRTVNYLAGGESFGGAVKIHDPSGYPGLRGVMTWSINWDAAGGFRFSEAMRAWLDGLS